MRGPGIEIRLPGIEIRVPGIEVRGPGIEMRGPGIEIGGWGGGRNGSSARCSESVKGPDHKAWLWLYRSPHKGCWSQRDHELVPKMGFGGLTTYVSVPFTKAGSKYSLG